MPSVPRLVNMGQLVLGEPCFPKTAQTLTFFNTISPEILLCHEDMVL